MRQAEIRLRLALVTEGGVILPQKQHRFKHPGEVSFHPLADITPLFQPVKAPQRLSPDAGKQGADAAPLQVAFHFFQVALQNQPQPQAILAAEHHVKMAVAEADLIRSFPHVRFHH